MGEEVGVKFSSTDAQRSEGGMKAKATLGTRQGWS